MITRDLQAKFALHRFSEPQVTCGLMNTRYRRVGMCEYSNIGSLIIVPFLSARSVTVMPDSAGFPGRQDSRRLALLCYVKNHWESRQVLFQRRFSLEPVSMHRSLLYLTLETVGLTCKINFRYTRRTRDDLGILIEIF